MLINLTMTWEFSARVSQVGFYLLKVKRLLKKIGIIATIVTTDSEDEGAWYVTVPKDISPQDQLEIGDVFSEVFRGWEE